MRRSGSRGRRPLWVIVIVVILAGISQLTGNGNLSLTQWWSDFRSPQITQEQGTGSADEQRLRDAIRAQQSDVQVRGTGEVIRLLRDDLKGSRHQKFLIRVAGGTTILVAHNIDLAPRIDSLQVGDRIDFYGEYEWTDKGGVIHWTHHDPGGRHVDGWLEHAGRRYE
ncbi:DUF3465 domain-containing protein [Cobetia marina]|uniref:DUF3465 domain-containing protein n=1 Tax=Cobetia marina TaxID=28258 RepID=UPI0011433011|nr:DUF3465 domain-containing protein [Cobetia marina]GED44113.1 hypothetical protein HHA02_34420 [Cobetia marina]